MNAPRLRLDGRILLAALALLLLALLGPVYLSGRAHFWGDLTYLHHPWRVLVAQSLARGELPLWNRFAYLGMPLAGEMQCAAWYPLSVPFGLFAFPTALGVFQALHLALAAFFAFLWLRRLRAAPAAAAGGAALLMLCGGLASRLPFLNHLSTLALLPALGLFAGSTAPLGLALACAFLGGYPPMAAGAAFAAFLFEAWAGGRSGLAACARRWLGAAFLAAGLSALLLLPGLALSSASRRGGGMELAETLSWSFAPRDLVQLLPPPLIPAGELSAPLNWWKTAYLGFGAWAAVLAGVFALGSSALFAGAYAGGTLLLMLGGSNPLSRALWTWLPPLRYIRYPGNTAYLLIPLAALLAARGLNRRRGAWLWSAALALELLVYAVRSQPVVPRGYFADPGPLVEVLRVELDGHRYLPSPRALQWQRGSGVAAEGAFYDLKHRLYGLTNVPFRLESVGNFGEPLVPAPQYAFMDLLYRQPGLAALARLLPWADARVVLTRERLPSGELSYLGDSVWQLYRAPESQRALWFDEASGAAIPASAESPAPDYRRGRPLPFSREGENRLRVRWETESPGWLYLAEPLGPGWTARGPGGALEAEPAMTAFRKLRAAAGRSEVLFRYDPASWRAGRALTLLVLMVLAAYWYNRARSFSGPPRA
ncbi:MAG: hypothetical protein WC969_08715 [Elusimicrobiota bacterium]